MSITQQLARLGLPIPKAIDDTDDLRRVVLAATVFSDNVDVDKFTYRIRSRTLKPADVAKEVQALGELLAARQSLLAHAADISRALDYADKVALLAAADELYAALRPIVIEQGTLLAAAVSILGPAPDSRLLAQLGSAAGASWGAFDSALAALREVEAIVAEIATAGGAIRHLPAVTWCDLDAVTSTADLDRVTATFGKFPQLAHLGYLITLNTPGEVATALQRIAGVDTAARAAEEARKQAEIATNRADFDARSGVPAR